VTFICGRAGVCALGAVAAKHAGDDESSRYYLAQFQQVLQFDYKYQILRNFLADQYSL